MPRPQKPGSVARRLFDPSRSSCHLTLCSGVNSAGSATQRHLVHPGALWKKVLKKLDEARHFVFVKEFFSRTLGKTFLALVWVYAQSRIAIVTMIIFGTTVQLRPGSLADFALVLDALDLLCEACDGHNLKHLRYL